MPSRSRWIVLLVVLLVRPAGAQLPDAVVASERALDLLKTGQTDAAAKQFESLLAANPADAAVRATDELARRWLTRLDREQVKTQLQAVYRQQIEYPAALPATIRPAADRWGQPWVYRPLDLKRIAGTRHQSYRLESATLGPASDLAAALANLAAAFPWKILRADDRVVTFTRPGNPQPVLLSAGTTLDGVTVLEIGKTEILLCDGDRWRRLPAPARGP